MFVVNGGVYAVCAPIWGYMCDKKVPPIFITAIGSLFITVSFMFIGPAPFIPLPTIYEVCVAMLVVHGIGFAAELVAGFSSAHREAVRNGFPDNLDTYALISGLWTATFALGACIGPTVAGFLVDYFHFRNATLFVVASQISVLLISGMFMFKQYKAAKLQREYAELGKQANFCLLFLFRCNPEMTFLSPNSRWGCCRRSDNPFGKPVP